MTKTIHIKLETRTYDAEFDEIKLEKQICEAVNKMEDHLNRLITNDDVDILIEGGVPNEY